MPTPRMRWKSPSTGPQPDGVGWRSRLCRSAVPGGEEVDLRFGDDCRLRLTRGEQTIFDGLWSAVITIDGKPLKPAEPWEDVCWHSDSDGDYQELECRLTNDWRLQRQILLTREDRFLYLADSVLGPEGAEKSCRIDYAGSFCLGKQIRWEPAAETFDGKLKLGKLPAATVIPPAFPEWRTERTPGELTAADGELRLRAATEGRNLCVPLFLDLDPARAKQPLTWRRLTVGETLEVVPRDVAAASRVQIGDRQWVFYRALAGRGNRTVLGHNTAYEFACLRFLPSGKLETILEIE